MEQGHPELPSCEQCGRQKCELRLYKLEGQLLCPRCSPNRRREKLERNVRANGRAAKEFDSEDN